MLKFSDPDLDINFYIKYVFSAHNVIFDGDKDLDLELLDKCYEDAVDKVKKKSDKSNN